MERTRYNDFDVLRALIIVSAFILHYDLKIGLGTLVMPSLFIQRYVFTVGGFFFFVAGYMARTIYLPAFAKDAAGTSARIFVKGLKILTIYLSYVFLMRVCTGSSIPGSFIPFVYDHAFTMIILFTFSLLFMLTPLILYCAYNHPKAIVAMLTAMILFVILYNKGWPLSFEIKKILIDRTLSAYPLLPALMVYAFGYGAGSVDGRFQGKNTHAYANLAAENGYQPAQRLKVEPMTLKALVRERIEAGKDMPSDLFNVFAGNRTKIIRK